MKYAILLTIIFSLLFTNVFGEESAIEKQLIFFVVPAEVDIESGMITKLRVLFENTGETSLWLLSNSITSEQLRSITFLDDGTALGTGRSKYVTTGKRPPAPLAEYIEIKPNVIYGKTLTLSTMNQRKLSDYQGNKIIFKINVGIKMAIDDENLERITLKTPTRQSPVNLRISKPDESIEEKE